MSMVSRKEEIQKYKSNKSGIFVNERKANNSQNRECELL